MGPNVPHCSSNLPHCSSPPPKQPEAISPPSLSSPPPNCFTARETHPQYPFSHTYHHHCVYHSVDHAHLPPICCYDELLSRLKKTHCDPGFRIKISVIVVFDYLYITFSIIAAALSAFLPLAI
ncbi:hypothetical protein NC652_019282 [Populus alba x Populus x berolinensis]|nr:hypothetical protein NC652_019282 [Populus alba x Populus x berolinensis]